MTEAIVSDAKQRAMALDPNRSFICEAPAGSGKTELLTQRLLTLLARVQQPEEVLAITFTRKAAGEMRHRVIEALKRALSPPQDVSEHQRLTLSLAQAVLDVDREQQWYLIDAPSRLHIKTFDSVCASLASTLPMYSSFATPPQISEESEQLYIQASQNFLMSLEEAVPWADALAQVLSLLDNNMQRVERLFVSMLSRRESWLPLIGRGADKHAVISALEQNLQVVREECIVKIKNTIPHYHLKTLITLGGFAAGNVKRQELHSPLLACTDIDMNLPELPGADVEGIKQWSGLVAMLLAKNGTWRKKMDKRCGFPTGETADEKVHFREKKLQCQALINSLSECQGLHDLLLDIRNLPSPQYDDEQKRLLNALIDILPILSAYLSMTFQEKNDVDFSEVSIRARDALGKLDSPSELALALDYKIQHILVDEFQDTSPTQVELLELLTGGWEAGDGRTLFCVGDAMQSIYGFRGANVGLFLQCISHGLGDVPLEPIRLNTNFRSQAGIVDWINNTFSASFPLQHDISVGAVAYAHSVAFQAASAPQSVWVHGFTGDDSLNDEGQKVVSLVRQARQTNAQATIAILVRNRNHAMHITPQLKDAGFAYRAVDLEPLADNMVVQDLVALTHALLRPADSIAWLAILRAPWCGLSLVDLEAIANTQSTETQATETQATETQATETHTSEAALVTIFQKLKYAYSNSHEELLALSSELSSEKSPELVGQRDFFLTQANNNEQSRVLTADGKERLHRVVPILEAAMQQAQRKSLRQLVEGTWLALAGPACLQHRGDQKNAELFLGLLDELDHSAVLKSRDALDRAVAKLYSLPDPRSDETLQIMTIHKAKGLEFDTVIVPSLHRNNRPQDPELLRWHERLTETRERHLLMSPITSSGKDKDAVYHYLASQDKRREQNEICRLLYVACTRAKQQLHLMGEVKPDKNDEQRLSPPGKASLFHPIWNAVQLQILRQQPDENEAQTVPLSEEPAPKPRYLRRLPSQWQMPTLATRDVLDQYVPFYLHENPEYEIQTLSDQVPRAIGSYVHRVLKDLDEATLGQWHLTGVDHLVPMWRQQLRSYAIPMSRLEEAVGRVKLTLAHIAADTSNHWLFSNTLPFRETEYSLSTPSPQGFSQLVLDLLINDGSHTWIVDYKTAEPGEGQLLEDFVDNEMKTYRDKMLAYKKAIQQLDYKNIKLALYFPMISRFVEYSDIPNTLGV